MIVLALGDYTLSVDSNQRPNDLATRWSKWARTWQARLLGLSGAVILITWLTLAVLAYLSNRDRIIGVHLPD
jgi:hypothetical protein